MSDSVMLPAVYPFSAEYRQESENIARSIGTRTADRTPADGELYLSFGKGGLALCGDGMELRCDLEKMLPRLKRNNLGGEMLVKAARFKNAEGQLRAVDATAGFGEDSLLLAASGYEVTLFEYNPVIAALLADGLRRASQIPELTETVAKMKLICGDSTCGMRGLDFEPDLVLLDPMFPGRQKSGLIKKKFQLLQRLEAPCGTEEELMLAARAANPRRIVIKRPAKGPFLAGVKPSYSLDGDSIRYDVIVLR